MKGKSIFGYKEEYVAAFSYLGVFVTGLIVYLMERENKFVRFHALQSTILFGGLAALNLVVNLLTAFGGAIPILGILFAVAGSLISTAISIVSIVALLYLAYSAYRGITFKVPIIGNIVWEQVNK